MSAAVQLLPLTSSLDEIPRLADAVEAFCEPLAPGPRDLHALQLALEEAVTNVITHGYGDQPGAQVEVRAIPIAAAPTED